MAWLQGLEFPARQATFYITYLCSHVGVVSGRGHGVWLCWCPQQLSWCGRRVRWLEAAGAVVRCWGRGIQLIRCGHSSCHRFPCSCIQKFVVSCYNVDLYSYLNPNFLGLRPACDSKIPPLDSLPTLHRPSYPMH